MAIAAVTDPELIVLGGPIGATLLRVAQSGSGAARGHRLHPRGRVT